MKLAIAYSRVSRESQSRSGLGLEAQDAYLYPFAEKEGFIIVYHFIEVESGKNNDRQKINEAVELCKKLGATLLISTLDRLARDAFFVETLLYNKIPFICVDAPNDSPFIIRIKAAIAQEEREKTSQRTKDALAAAKARGVKLGTPHTNALATWNRQAAIAFAEQLRPIIERYAQRDITTVRAVMKELIKEKVPTPSGKGSWHITSVYAVLLRLKDTARTARN